MQQWGSRSAAAYGTRAGETLRVLNDCFGQPVAQASPFASAVPSPLPTVPVGKGGSRAQKWETILQRQKTNRKPEWICCTCLSSNWLKQTQCRGCEREARGWLLVPKGAPPVGPPKSGKTWQQHAPPASHHRSTGKGKGKGQSRDSRDTAMPETPPLNAAVSTAMDVDAEWDSMTRQDLQMEQGRLQKSLDSLGSGTHTQAVRDVIQKELKTIDRALQNKRSSGQRLDMAESALRKATAALQKCENRVQSLVQQLEDARADVMYHASAKKDAEAAVSEIRQEYARSTEKDPPPSTVSGIANQVWDLIQQDPRLVSVDVLEGLLKGLAKVPLAEPVPEAVPVAPPAMPTGGTNGAGPTQVDSATQDNGLSTQAATAEAIAAAHQAEQQRRQEQERRQRSRSPK